MRLTQQPPRALFGSRTADPQQRRMRQRLIRLFTMLMLVLALMQHASNPTNWNWFWTVTTPSAPTPEAHSAKPSGSSWEPASADDATASAALPVLDAELLRSVQDDTYFRPEESEAWFQLFAYLRDASPAQLQQASQGNATYLQLYRQTDFYRGRIVQLQGTLRRAHAMEAPANEHGITNYWQCWLFPESGGTTPIVVYSLNLPSRAGEGMEMAVPVRLHACVYKRWAYARGDSMLVAPVVLAANMEASLRREPVAPRTGRVSNPGSVGLPVLLLGCLALAALGVVAATVAFRSGAVAARSRPPADLRIQSPQATDDSPNTEARP